MSAERLQQSLRRLHETADALKALEVGASASGPTLDDAPPAVAISTLPSTARPRSMARVVALTLAHSAASVAVLALVCAAGDPLVPRPDRPSLAAAVEVDGDVAAAEHAIPQKGSKRP